MCLLKIVVTVLVVGGAATTARAQSCYRDGDTVTVRGIASVQPLELANGSARDVWVLAVDPPLCLAESPNGTHAQHETNVSRVQIVGQPPPLGTAIELTGKLSTANITQYYAESTAINVISGRRIPELNFDPHKVAQQSDGASAAPTTEQSSDPYADDYANAAKAKNAEARTDFERERGRYLDSIRVLYFAHGCKVFQYSLQQAGATLLLGDLTKNIDDAHVLVLNNDRVAAALDPSIGESQRQELLADRKLIEGAERDGLARAKEASACDYWHQHPEAVYAIRKAAEAEFPQ